MIWEKDHWDPGLEAGPIRAWAPGSKSTSGLVVDSGSCHRLGRRTGSCQPRDAYVGVRGSQRHGCLPGGKSAPDPFQKDPNPTHGPPFPSPEPRFKALVSPDGKTGRRRRVIKRQERGSVVGSLGAPLVGAATPTCSRRGSQVRGARLALSRRVDWEHLPPRP